MSKKNARSDIRTKPSKTNPLNDGVKNTAAQQNISTQLNMPRGAKKPEQTPK